MSVKKGGYNRTYSLANFGKEQLLENDQAARSFFGNSFSSSHSYSGGLQLQFILQQPFHSLAATFSLSLCRRMNGSFSGSPFNLWQFKLRHCQSRQSSHFLGCQSARVQVRLYPPCKKSKSKVTKVGHILGHPFFENLSISNLIM